MARNFWLVVFKGQISDARLECDSIVLLFDRCAGRCIHVGLKSGLGCGGYLQLGMSPALLLLDVLDAIRGWNQRYRIFLIPFP